MECSSSNPYASPWHVVGNVVSARDPSHGMPGVPGSTEDDPRQDQRQTAVRGRQILIVMRDDRVISYPCSSIKCILELPNAVLWMNANLSTSGGRQMAPYEATTSPMASDPHSGKNVDDAWTHVERTALVSAPNSAVDDVDIGHFGGHVEKEWPIQSTHRRSAPSNLHEITGPFQDRKETISPSSVTSPVHESSSRNRLGPNKTVQPFSTDQFPNCTCRIPLAFRVRTPC